MGNGGDGAHRSVFVDQDHFEIPPDLSGRAAVGGVLIEVDPERLGVSTPSLDFDLRCVHGG